MSWNSNQYIVKLLLSVFEQRFLTSNNSQDFYKIILKADVKKKSKQIKNSDKVHYKLNFILFQIKLKADVKNFGKEFARHMELLYLKAALIENIKGTIIFLNI